MRRLGSDRSGALLGMLAFEAPWIRHFAIFAEHQRQGVGTALLERDASVRRRKSGCSRSSARQARAFYEKHGFVAVAFGISPAPELNPDVEYRWPA